MKLKYISLYYNNGKYAFTITTAQSDDHLLNQPIISSVDEAHIYTDMMDADSEVALKEILIDTIGDHILIMKMVAERKEAAIREINAEVK